MKDIVAILSHIRSVHNVGSIFRTADAAGVEKLFLCGITPTPLDRFKNVRKDFEKVSLGAEKTVLWEYAKDAYSLILKLKLEGYMICAVEQATGSIPYTDFKPRRKKIALIFGNEIRGVSKNIIRQSDVVLEIPMRGEKESLNVSVAFGIAVYEMKR